MLPSPPAFLLRLFGSADLRLSAGSCRCSNCSCCIAVAPPALLTLCTVVSLVQVQRLQLLLHKHWPAEQYPALAELALMNCGTVQRRDALSAAVTPLPEDRLRHLVCHQLRYGLDA